MVDDLQRIAHEKHMEEAAAAAAANKDKKGGKKLDAEEAERIIPEAAKKRHNVYEIFRRYDEDGSDSISKCVM